MLYDSPSSIVMTPLRRGAMRLILFLVLLATLLFSSSEAHALSVGGAAQSLLPLEPFGGMVLLTWPCTCSGNGWATVVGPPTPASTLYSVYRTRLHLYYMPLMSAWVLGQDQKGKSCHWVAGPFCPVFYTRGVMYHTGTSIPGASL